MFIANWYHGKFSKSAGTLTRFVPYNIGVKECNITALSLKACKSALSKTCMQLSCASGLPCVSQVACVSQAACMPQVRGADPTVYLLVFLCNNIMILWCYFVSITSVKLVT